MAATPNNHESKYWKSLREYHNDPSVNEDKAREFAKDVTGEFDVDSLSPISRKQFLALVSASAAFAAAGCTNYRDKGEIVPYTRKPEEITLGTANYYASTFVENGQEYGILIKTREGRPIKVDGNPDHPVNKGKVTSRVQASVMGLYDPERLKDPMIVTGGILSKSNWIDADAKVSAALAATVKEGKEIAVVTHTVTSPTLKAVLADFAAKFPTTKVYSYELFHNGNRNEGWKKSTGGSSFPLIKWNEANVILALESDFLGTEGNVAEQTRGYAAKKDMAHPKSMSRVYSADGTMNSTGMNADYRLRVRPDQQLEFVLALINEFKPNGTSLSAFGKKNGLDAKDLKQLVKDLAENKGKSIVHAGNTLPVDVHVAVNALNDILGNSALYNKEQAAVEQISLSGKQEWETLVANLNGGKVGVVVHVDANPVYHFPTDLGYTEALKKAALVVSLSGMESETTVESAVVLPLHHTFEAWGDHQTRTGILSLQQPVIAPLYNTRQAEGILLAWTGVAYTETLAHEYLMKRWEKAVYPSMKASVDFKTFWLSSLHDGVVTFAEAASSVPAVKGDALNGISAPAAASGFALLLHESVFVGDGRFANNGWLQEMPHPASKIAWDNYAALSVATAKELGVSEGGMVDVAAGTRSLKLPVHVQPGLSDNFVAVMLGYGRTNAGTVGSNVGFNANTLMSKTASLSSWLYTGVQVTKTSDTYLLASSQEHFNLDDTFLKDIHKKREIIREGTVIQYLEEPKFLNEGEKHAQTIIPRVTYDGVKWAMAIDLNKCTGCGTCTISCNVENNIPVVGKEQVHKGREMTWIRIDRYFSGTSDAPSVSNQPMLCQQCDGAPCESVCPVIATTHSPDGLNQMAYNRCVGTKYCSNNCPFKARRFNFYNFRNEFAEGIQNEQPLNMMHNPEVTVRSRGVMEKCTFCVQRIMEARQHAIEEGKTFDGSGVTVACQDACPADAIVFGNVNDKNSLIHKYRQHEIGYRVLEELNIGPNVTYIAKLRNIESHSENA